MCCRCLCIAGTRITRIRPSARKTDCLPAHREHGIHVGASLVQTYPSWIVGDRACVSMRVLVRQCCLLCHAFALAGLHDPGIHAGPQGHGLPSWLGARLCLMSVRAGCVADQVRPLPAPFAPFLCASPAGVPMSAPPPPFASLCVRRPHHQQACQRLQAAIL